MFGYLPNLVEGICILIVLIVNGGLVMREYRLAATEMPVRLQDVSLHLKTNRSNHNDVYIYL